MIHNRYFRFALIAALLAIAIRWFIFFGRTLPIEDGGLWLIVAQAILENRFHLPATIIFNAQVMPWCYPPLAGYLLALIHSLGGVELITLITFIPPLLNIAAVAAFCWFVFGYERERRVVMAALLLFPLATQSYQIFLAGGGVSRNLGLLFQLLSWGIAVRSAPSSLAKRNVVIGVFNGLAILSHPTGGLWSTLGIVFLGTLERRFSLRSLAAVGAVSLLMIAPWLLVVIPSHGVIPFLNAFGVSGNEMFSWKLWGMPERWMLPGQFLGVFAFIGLLTLTRDRRALVPALFVFAFIFDHRGLFVLNGVVIGVLAAAHGAVRVYNLLPDPGYSENRTGIAQRLYVTIFVLALIISNASILRRYHGAALHPTAEEFKAYQDFPALVPAGTKVLYLRSSTPMPETGEWLSALSGSEIHPLPQGGEWDGSYGREITLLQKVGECCDRGSWECVREVAGAYHWRFDIVAVHTPSCGAMPDQVLQDIQENTIGPIVSFRAPF